MESISGQKNSGSLPQIPKLLFNRMLSITCLQQAAFLFSVLENMPVSNDLLNEGKQITSEIANKLIDERYPYHRKPIREA